MREGATQAEQLAWREALPEDLPLLAGMNWRLIQDEGHSNPMSPAELENRMRRWLDNGEYRAVIFALGSEPVAYIVFREDTTGVYIRQFYVEQGARRQGIGRRAIELLRRELFPVPCRLTLEVLCGNQTGRDFWAAVGFQEYAVTMELWN